MMAIKKDYLQRLRQFMMPDAGIQYPFRDVDGQEDRLIASMGPQFALVYGIINNPSIDNVITGPCFIPSSEMSRYRNCDSAEAREMLDKSPTVQNVVCVGLPKNGRGRVVLETKEYGMLNPNVDEEHVIVAANRSMGMIQRYNSIVIGNDTRGYAPLSTHDADVDGVIRDSIRAVLSDDPQIKDHRFLRDCSSPGDFERHGRLRIEVTYTPQFAERLFGKGCSYTITENYKHGIQLVSDSSILKRVAERAIRGGRLNFIGLIPPKSLEGKPEMDDGKPIYIGNSQDIAGGLTHIDMPITSARTTRIADLLIALGEADLALDMLDLVDVRKLAAKTKVIVSKELIGASNSALGDLRSEAVKRIRDKINSISGDGTNSTGGFSASEQATLHCFRKM